MCATHPQELSKFFLRNQIWKQGVNNKTKQLFEPSKQKEKFAKFRVSQDYFLIMLGQSLQRLNLHVSNYFTCYTLLFLSAKRAER